MAKLPQNDIFENDWNVTWDDNDWSNDWINDYNNLDDWFNFEPGWSSSTLEDISRINKNLRNPDTIDQTIGETRNLISNLISNTNERYAIYYTDPSGFDRVCMINPRQFDQLMDQLQNGYSDESDVWGSDSINQLNLGWVSNVRIGSAPNHIHRRNNDGKFFKYFNTTKFDLTKFQIYTESQQPDKDEHCLFHTLKMSKKFTKDQLEVIKMMLTDQACPKRMIKQITNQFDVCVHLDEFDSEGKLRTTKSCKKDNPCKVTIPIALFENHYFINEWQENGIHEFAAKYHNYINFDNPRVYEFYAFNGQKNDFSKIKYSNKYSKKPISIIKTLLENDAFVSIPLDKINSITGDDVSSDTTTIIYPPKLSEPIINLNEDLDELNYVERDWREKFDYIVFADFECTTDSKTHEAFCISYAILNANHLDNPVVQNIYGLDCAEVFLSRLPQNACEKRIEFVRNKYKEKNKNYQDIVVKPSFLIYFHNLKYDWQQIFKHVKINESVEMNNQLYEMKSRYHNKTLTFRDSYKMIPEPLRNFKDMFKLESQKELFPYDFYTSKRISENIYDTVLKAAKHIRHPFKKLELIKQKEFVKLARKYRTDDGYFDHVSFAKFYCDQDTRVLAEGYLKFNILCFEALALDSFNFLTISSLADNYFLKQGCFEGVHQLSGPTRSFVQRALTGGRVMLSEKTKKLNGDVNKILQDFDGVSLYPSAYARLEGIGFPVGVPKVLQTTKQETLNSYNHYVVEIKITKVNQSFDFPMHSYFNKEKLRVWSNEVPPSNIVLSKIALEDLIKYAEIEFEIIRGLYWNEGFNDKCVDTMKFLFSQRLHFKNLKNPIQNVFKLVMNSAFGKTCMKAQNTTTVYKYGKDEITNYVSKNYNQIESIVRYDSKQFGKDDEGLYTIPQKCYKIKVYTALNKHKNRVQCGDIVTAMSKRIMNEVSYVAKCADVPLYYCDTDSIHMENDDIEKLSNKFKEIYNKELIGKSLGQFHSDFDSSNFKDENNDRLINHGEIKNIVSLRGVFIAPKVYCDYLQGELNNEKVYAYHVRAKGIRNEAIYLEAEKNYNGNVCDLFASGKIINFDLSCDNTLPCFMYDTDGVKTNKKFIREVNFGVINGKESSKDKRQRKKPKPNDS